MSPKRTTPLFSYRLIVGVVLFLFSAVGCTGQNETIAANATLATTLTATLVPASFTPTVSTTPTLTTTVTPLPTLTPTLTATTTPSPSPTSTPTPLPTLTPLSTIPPQQRGQTYADLMSNNGGCELPCWWGFEMGVASLDEVRQFYTAFDAHISERQIFDPYVAAQDRISELTVVFIDPQIEAGIQVTHTFVAQYGIVFLARIGIFGDPSYQIELLLQRLGQPSEIWMWTIPESYEGILPARFRLYFPDRGVFVRFSTEGERVEDSVHVCFNKEYTTVRLWNPAIWDPEGTKSIVEAANEGDTLEGYPIDEVSNWDVEDFYTILVNPTHTECLETPASLWPSP